MDNSRFIVPCQCLTASSGSQTCKSDHRSDCTFSACTSHHASLGLIFDPFQDRTCAWCSAEGVSLSGAPSVTACTAVAVRLRRHLNNSRDVSWCSTHDHPRTLPSMRFNLRYCLGQLPSRVTYASPHPSRVPIVPGEARCLLKCVLAQVARVILFRHLPRIPSCSSSLSVMANPRHSMYVSCSRGRQGLVRIWSSLAHCACGRLAGSKGVHWAHLSLTA